MASRRNPAIARMHERVCPGLQRPASDTPLMAFEAYLDQINTASGSGDTLADSYASDIKVSGGSGSSTGWYVLIGIGAFVVVVVASRVCCCGAVAGPAPPAGFGNGNFVGAVFLVQCPGHQEARAQSLRLRNQASAQPAVFLHGARWRHGRQGVSKRTGKRLPPDGAARSLWACRWASHAVREVPGSLARSHGRE